MDMFVSFPAFPGPTIWPLSRLAIGMVACVCGMRHQHERLSLIVIDKDPFHELYGRLIVRRLHLRIPLLSLLIACQVVSSFPTTRGTNFRSMICGGRVTVYCFALGVSEDQ